jgi:hypothetical protein
MCSKRIRHKIELRECAHGQMHNQPGIADVQNPNKWRAQRPPWLPKYKSCTVRDCGGRAVCSTEQRETIEAGNAAPWRFI